jgi:hypothetical protein
MKNRKPQNIKQIRFYRIGFKNHSKITGKKGKHRKKEVKTGKNRTILEKKRRNVGALQKET